MADSNVTVNALFGRRPDAAIDYLKSKKPKAQIDYAEVQGRAHDHAFVVAKMTDLDMTAKVHQSLVDAMEQNLSFDDWQASIEPMLKENGWWGKKEMAMPDGTSKMVQLGSDHRLKRIYETNINQAYHKAREHHGDYDVYPYAMWMARGDDRTRPSHKALDGKIFRRDDPYYQSIKPRKAWNCRCDEILLTAEQAQRYVRNEGLEMYEDISEYVKTETVIVQGANGAYSAPVNVVRLPGQPVYRTDPGWIHAGDALPLQPTLDKAGQVPAKLGANLMLSVLQRPNVLKRFNEDVKKWIQSVNTKRPKGEYRQIGVVHPQFIDALATKGVDLDSAVITLHDRISLQHLDRAHKAHDPEWLVNIARNLTGKHDLYWDNIKDAPILVFNVDDAKYKLIVHLNHRIKGRDVVDGKQNFIGNVIRTITVDGYKNIETGTNYTWLASIDN